MTSIGRLAVRGATGAVVERLEGRMMLSASLDDGVWRIEGDGNPQQLADTIVISLNATKTQVKATINGQLIGTTPVAGLNGVVIEAGVGNDIVNVNLKGLEDTIWADIYGGAGDDSLSGGAQSDCMYGEGGNDTIYGLGGEDWLSGGEGEDSVVGGDGDDIIYGGGG